MKKIIYLMMTAALLCGYTDTKDGGASIHGSVVVGGEPVNAAAIPLTPGGGTKITGNDGY
jgi:hypothetical protein